VELQEEHEELESTKPQRNKGGVEATVTSGLRKTRGVLEPPRQTGYILVLVLLVPTFYNYFYCMKPIDDYEIAWINFTAVILHHCFTFR